MEGGGCMGAGAPPQPGPGPGPGFRTWVFDLGNSCPCYECRQKTSTVLNKLEGVREHCYNLEKNQLTVTGTMDQDTVIKKLSKVKKHVRVRVMLEPADFMNQPPPPPPGHHSDPPQQPPPPPPSHFQGPSANPAPPPQHPPPCGGCYHGPPPPPPPGNNNAPPPGGANHPLLFVHSDEPPPSSVCHCPPPPPPHCTHGTPPPPLPHHPAHIHTPPPCSAGQCPPPGRKCRPHSGALGRHQSPYYPADMVGNFIHGKSSSPLIPSNVCTAGILGQLGNIKRLKHVDLIKQKGIKLTFEDGQVKSYHPTSCMELRPAYDSSALLPPHQLPHRYVSPFSDEYPTGPSCTIV